MHKRLIIAIFVCFFASQNDVSATLVVIRQTGITGAQTFLNASSSYYWQFQFTGSTSYDEAMASFMLKEAPNTSEPSIASLWSSDASGAHVSLLGQFSIQPTGNPSAQSFHSLDYMFPAVTPQLPEYFNLEFYSSAPTGSSTWYIKTNSEIGFFDGGGQALSGFSVLGSGAGTPGSTAPTGGGGSGGSTVPEPSGLLLIASLALAAVLRRRF